MKVIKFRAWDGEKMVYDKPTTNTKEEKVTRLITMSGDVRTCIWHKGGGISLNPFGHYELMQFTGLKDKNGKEIYDGDVCFINDGFIGKKRQILWDDSLHGWAHKILEDVESAAGKKLKNSIRLIQYFRVDDIKVIGNIHENPKLCQ